MQPSVTNASLRPTPVMRFFETISRVSVLSRYFGSSFAGGAARASTINGASGTKRFWRLADLTSEPNQGQMHSHSPISRYESLKGKPNLLVLRLLSNDSQPLANSRHVRVDRHSRMAGYEGKHDIRRLVAHAR